MFKKIAIAAALAVVASSSFAQQMPRPAIYAGADVGSTKFDGISDRQSSFGAFVGYQFHPNFSIEAGYRRLGEFDQFVGSTKVGVTVDQTALSFIGSVPLQSGFNVYGRLGYNRLDAKGSVSGYGSASDSTSGVLYGVGVGYTFTPNITARLEAQRPSSDSSNIGASLSLKF
ncbi:outer membrane beta-barrel protein [Massilia sp. R2A-15]|uniref:outer membrane beta-barrel protein n=1 Tax=Massilia sp. R2A-15 TaxID=3064278 RepID=UPI002733F22A|nr:outer membrane beta-barrel protein [Massilia sp. R2A-15]WLI87937.1 outer membrane beta-barrel protein [Massilia sp. R2A-15]